MKTITIEGCGAISAAPDHIRLQISLHARHAEYDEALAEGARRAQALKDAATRTGFAPQEVTISTFHVSALYESVPDKRGNYHRAFTAYECRYQLSLLFPADAERLSTVLTAMAECGAEAEVDIAFTVADDALLREAALADAARDARRRAEILCRASGVELGELLEIRHGDSRRDLLSPTRYTMDAEAGPLLAKRAYIAPDLTPDEMEITASATLVWALKP